MLSGTLDLQIVWLPGVRSAPVHHMRRSHWHMLECQLKSILGGHDALLRVEQASVLPLVNSLVCNIDGSCDHGSFVYPEDTLRSAHVSTALLRDAPATLVADDRAAVLALEVWETGVQKRLSVS